jgi:hypothetical protein
MNCSICGDTIEVTWFGWAEGNNAEPVNDGRCCDTCNFSVVLPERMEALRTWDKEALIHAEFGTFQEGGK